MRLFGADNNIGEKEVVATFNIQNIIRYGANSVGESRGNDPAHAEVRVREAMAFKK